jgi:exonuclease SbcC
MILEYVKLENIRSYTNQKIEFPTGSVLLAGDIGAGKSTILLSIEFALFGLKSGELTGSALLRHGSREGSVELKFKVEDKEVIVKRTLKRGKDRIGQSAGYIIINDVKEELMPKELRAKIFSLLDYPESLVSKGQDLIYRFTVYTPQEEMKRIIYENKDSRLDTLRKVFNIDKYKRIRENILIYVKSLKDRKNNFEGRIEDLEEKKKQRKELDEQVSVLKLKEKEIEEKFKQAKEKTKAEKIRLEKIELQIKEYNELKRNKELLDLELKNIIEKREKDKKEIDLLQKSVLKLKEELKDFKDEHGLKELYEDKERRQDTAEKELNSIRKERAEIKGKILHLKESAEKLLKLDNCPLCMQEVPHSHKEEIVGKNNSEIAKIKEKYDSLEKKEKELTENLQFFKRELREMRERMTMNKALLVKKENQIEKEAKLNSLIESFSESKIKVAGINSKKLELNKKTDSFKEIDEEYKKLKEAYEKVQEQERKIELEKNSLDKEKEGLQKQVVVLEKEILEKENIKKELKKIKELQNWLEDKFISLVANMEKHVFMTVYHEFNELFQKWFSMLVEDELINVRLDDSFSVIVEQNGYESFIENLSGGEKTSIALAYRLALNKVINDVVSQIRTKDILILDEPTEGFSTAQLDKVRDVLDELGISQIIIVSHEAKIESFVDNIVRIGKQEGVSGVN